VFGAWFLKYCFVVALWCFPSWKFHIVDDGHGLTRYEISTAYSILFQ